MRNLKRALSLALASVMLLGMMVVGSSAKGIDDFTDKAEIVNQMPWRSPLPSACSRATRTGPSAPRT